MSSGSLPLDEYHRAQSLGEGTYGSVVTVYNDSGEEYALKVFDNDEDNETLDLGTLREISILRLLRHENSHPNIISMVDVQNADLEEIGFKTSMAMPMYHSGDLEKGIQKGVISSLSRKKLVSIGHGILSAVAFLHDNKIIHRDLKSANIMLGKDYTPILVDFSLAKFCNDSETEDTHTGEIGTVTYVSPEVVAKQPYGLKSDCWSVGVVLLEMLQGSMLTVDRNKAAASLIEEAKRTLPDQPFANLIRGLLEIDVEKRLNAREALDSKVFQKFGLDVPEIKIIQLETALPFEEDCEDSSIERSKGGKSPNYNNRKTPVKLTPRERTIKRLCIELECTNPKTNQAAFLYAKELCKLEDDMDDLENSQALLDCVVLASKFYEIELRDLAELHEDYPSFGNWDLDVYRDSEATVFMMMEYCLYIR